MRANLQKVAVGVSVAVVVLTAALFGPAIFRNDPTTELATQTGVPTSDISQSSTTEDLSTTPTATEVPAAVLVITAPTPTAGAAVAKPSPTVAVPPATPTEIPAAPTPTVAVTTAPLVLATAAPVVPATATPAPPAPPAVPTATTTPEPTPEPVTQPSVEPTPKSTTEPTATPTTAPTTDAAAAPVAEPTAEATPAPTAAATVEPTPTPTPTTAIVQSTVEIAPSWKYVSSTDGLFLRDGPGGQIIDVLTFRSEVYVTGSVQSLGERTWAQVDIPANGWAALEFLTDVQPAAQPSQSTTGGPSEPPTAADWDAMRTCESGGRYDAVDPSGLYHGAYQFLPSTWDGLARRFWPELVGVLPSQATSADQDKMAFKLFELEGAQPWPTCGRHLL